MFGWEAWKLDEDQKTPYNLEFCFKSTGCRGALVVAVPGIPSNFWFVQRKSVGTLISSDVTLVE
jgi:hypothetical protein